MADQSAGQQRPGRPGGGSHLRRRRARRARRCRPMPRPPRLARSDGLHPARTDIAAAIRDGSGRAAAGHGPPSRAAVRRAQNQEQADAAAGAGRSRRRAVDVGAAGADPRPRGARRRPRRALTGAPGRSLHRHGAQFARPTRPRRRCTCWSTASLRGHPAGRPRSRHEPLRRCRSSRCPPATTCFACSSRPTPTRSPRTTRRARTSSSPARQRADRRGTPGDGQYLADALQTQGLQVDVTAARSRRR